MKSEESHGLNVEAGFNRLADNKVCCTDYGSAFCGYVTAAQLTGPEPVSSEQNWTTEQTPGAKGLHFPRLNNLFPFQIGKVILVAKKQSLCLF